MQQNLWYLWIYRHICEYVFNRILILQFGLSFENWWKSVFLISKDWYIAFEFWCEVTNIQVCMCFLNIYRFSLLIQRMWIMLDCYGLALIKMSKTLKSLNVLCNSMLLFYYTLFLKIRFIFIIARVICDLVPKYFLFMHPTGIVAYALVVLN